MDSMKTLVIGATGQTGRQIVKQLVEAGHTVTAFARTPSKVETYGGKVSVLQGDGRSFEDISRAVAGQDAVFSALGPRSFKKDDLQTVYMKNLVRAMEEQGISRLINLSAWGAGDSQPQSPWFFRLLHLTVLKHVFVDKQGGESDIQASSLNYTFARPGVLGNGKARGGVKASLQPKGLKPFINRADVAAFMVAQLTNTEWERQAPLIGY